VVAATSAGAPAGTYFVARDDSQTVALTAASGSATARRTLRRLLRAPGRQHAADADRDGLVDVYDAPAARPAGPGVLLFGGSSGGLASTDALAMLLASHGYHALALAYFGLPGLPLASRRSRRVFPAGPAPAGLWVPGIQT
jgi:hypothetical protein